MKNKPPRSAFIVFALALLLGACGPTAPPTPQLISPTALPTFPVEPGITTKPAEVMEAQPSLTPEATTEPSCTGIFKQELTFYPIPSDALPGERLSAGAYVDVIGELNEPVWYQVKLVNRVGWVLRAYVRLEDEKCKAPEKSLADILGLQGTPIFEDTFRDSQNWYLVYTPDQRPERLPDSLDNYTLNADGYFERVSLSAPPLENLSNFELAASYWRQNGGDQSSYVGIQYGNETQYFEARVYGNCNIVVTTSDGFYEEQTTRNERNNCKDSISDLIFVRWDGSGVLQVKQNDLEEPYRFNIGTSVPASGQIQLVTESTRVQFDFIAVTEN